MAQHGEEQVLPPPTPLHLLVSDEAMAAQFQNVLNQISDPNSAADAKHAQNLPDYRVWEDKGLQMKGKAPEKAVEKVPGALIAPQVRLLMAGLPQEDIEKIVQKVMNYKNLGQIFPSEKGRVDNNTPEQNYQASLTTGRKVLAAIDAATVATPTEQELKAFKDQMTRIFLSLYNVDFVAPNKDGSVPIRVTGNSSKDGSSLANTYNTATGSVTAQSNYQKQYGLRDPMKWSDVVFETYNQLKAMADRQGIPTQQISEVRRLLIVNIQTIDTLARVYKDHAGRLRRNAHDSTLVDWTPEDGDAFAAILGTPNGAGAGWLLADHYEELGGKKLASITTYVDEDLPRSGFASIIVKYA